MQALFGEICLMMHEGCGAQIGGPWDLGQKRPGFQFQNGPNHPGRTETAANHAQTKKPIDADRRKLTRLDGSVHRRVNSRQFTSIYVKLKRVPLFVNFHWVFGYFYCLRQFTSVYVSLRQSR